MINKNKFYFIKEIFGPTIQGEGSASGTVVHFIRFSGCNMWDGRPETREKSKCPFCDTDFFGGTKYQVNDVLTALSDLGPVENVVISGGEPGLQIDEVLIDSLKDAGYRIHIETNGSRPLPANIDHITVSPKVAWNDLRITKATDIKILYPPINKQITPENFKTFRADNFYIQPVDDKNKNENLKACLEFIYKNPKWKLSLQTHKIIGAK